jgi:hypothetical protein
LKKTKHDRIKKQRKAYEEPASHGSNQGFASVCHLFPFGLEVGFVSNIRSISGPLYHEEKAGLDDVKRKIPEISVTPKVRTGRSGHFEIHPLLCHGCGLIVNEKRGKVRKS